MCEDHNRFTDVTDFLFCFVLVVWRVLKSFFDSEQDINFFLGGGKGGYYSFVHQRNSGVKNVRSIQRPFES